MTTASFPITSATIAVPHDIAISVLIAWLQENWSQVSVIETCPPHSTAWFRAGTRYLDISSISEHFSLVNLLDDLQRGYEFLRARSALAAAAPTTARKPTILRNVISFPDHRVVCDPAIASPQAMADMVEALDPHGDQAKHRAQLERMNNDGSWTIEADDGEHSELIEKVKLGDFVKTKAGSKKVYKRGAYDRSTKSFSLTDCDDINREIFVKRGKLVFIGFTY